MHFSIDKYHFTANQVINQLLELHCGGEAGIIVKIEEKKGKIIYREGSYSLGVYILLKGKIKIYQTNKEGKEQIVYIYRAGDIMGYRPLLCSEPHPVSAATLEDTELSFIPRDHFMHLLEELPVLSRLLLTNLSHEFTVWINKLTVFGQQAVRERLALSLLILREKYKENDAPDAPVEIDLSREDLANYAGTTVETLVRMLRNFKNEGLINSKGRKISVFNIQQLERMADFS